MRRRTNLAFAFFFALGCQGQISTGQVGGDGDGGAPPSNVDAGPGADFETTVDVPLTPTPDNSSGVTTDGDGNLVLDPTAPSIVLSHIWVANSPDGTVSKIDTETGVEVARYRTGPGSPDPSRTTVGLDGDVVVANRGGASAVRIHADTETCPDVNMNGVIDTSSGTGDVLPWGTDECVLWYHAFPGGSLARAAAYDFAFDPDGIATSTVWIGLYQTRKLVRLDPDTGNVLAEIDIPGHCPYGLAFDGKGNNMWAFSACSGSVIRLDLATLMWEAIPLPGSCAYGITVDGDGNVWTSGGSCVGRYDPVGGMWTTTTVGSSNRGLAHDGNGSVWVADTSYGVHRINAATMAVQSSIPLSGGGFVGMAVDFNNKVWAISRGSSQAYRIDPGTEAFQGFPTGNSPYTYSDMTGFQLQNAAPPLGTLKATLEGCGPESEWMALEWTADTPPGTRVRFRARTGNDAAGLAAAGWAEVARQPGDSSPVDLAAALEAVTPGSSFATFLELEVILYSASAQFTPTVSEVKVITSCPPQVN